MAQDVWMWSDDPKDPRWRIRVVEQIEETGLVGLIEETTTSTEPSAQTAEVLNHIVLTADDLRRLHEMLGKVVARMPPLKMWESEGDIVIAADQADAWKVFTEETGMTPSDFGLTPDEALTDFWEERTTPLEWREDENTPGPMVEVATLIAEKGRGYLCGLEM